MERNQTNRRAQELANRFTEANNALIAAIEKFSEAKWEAICENDGRSVGVLVHHLASTHSFVGGLVKTVAAGQALPLLTVEMVNAGNAQHAQQFANCTKSETLNLLRLNGETTASSILQLNDDQLDLASPFAYIGGKMISVQGLIEDNLIKHIQEHLASIQKAARTANGI